MDSSSSMGGGDAPENSSLPGERGGTWGRARTLAFWVAGIYLFLYTFPFPVSMFPTWGVWKPRLGLSDQTTVVDGVGERWDSGVQWVVRTASQANRDAVLWFGRTGFGKQLEPNYTGSGDSTFAYFQALFMAVVALAAGLLLFALLRGRTPFRIFRSGLVLAARYYLAFTMFTYGFVKVFKTQFPTPSLSRLLEPIGDASPMGLVWTFMGASAPYNWFTGGGELLGGALLLFRRTTTLGALVVIAVMANVLALNLCYDVPVKLGSMHLLAIATALAWTDGRRLLRVFVLNRPTQPYRRLPLTNSRWTQGLGWVFKILIVVHIVWLQAGWGWSSYQSREGRPVSERPEFYGIWDVESFVADGEEMAPVTSDDLRWKRIIHDWEGAGGIQNVVIERMSGKKRRFRFSELNLGQGTERESSDSSTAEAVVVEEASQEPVVAADRVFRLYARRDKDLGLDRVSSKLRVERIDDDRMVLEGEFEDAEVRVELTRRLPEDFRLLGRGFHWINEFPYNR